VVVVGDGSPVSSGRKARFAPPNMMRLFRNHTRRDWMLLFAILAAGAWARMSHLERVGVRTVDEGSYCFFGLAMLSGDKGCIQDKPGQALILATGFTVLGRTQFAAVATTAALGLLTIPVLYCLGLLMRGKAAAVALAAGSAFLPYFLHYNRSAASDTNYILFCAVALCLFLLAVGGDGREDQEGDPDPGPAEPERPAKLKPLAASGVFWGIAATVNLAALPPFAVTWAFFALLCRWRRASPAEAARGLAVLAVGAAAGVALIELPLAWFIDFGKVWGQFSGHAGHISASQLRWEWAWHLWRFVGPLALLLALVGLASAKLWWRTPNALFPLLTFVLAAFYARAALSLPRLHIPILLGLMPLMGLGAAVVLTEVRRRLPRLPELGAGVALALVLLSVHAREARRIISLSSGYPDACFWLAERMGDDDKGLGTYTWWTFLSFTGRPFSFGSYVGDDGQNRGIAEALNRDDWRVALAEELGALHEKGYTFLVLDYLLFTRLVKDWSERGDERVPPAGIEHWRSLVTDFRPDRLGGTVIPNPIAADYETRAEDAHLPPLEDEPLGQSIYIYRVPELVRALSGRGAERAIPPDS